MFHASRCRLVLSICLLFLAPSTHADEPVSLPLFVSGEHGYGRYRIPALVTTTKGSVLAFCEGRVRAGGLVGDIDIVLRRSSDGGRTWDSQKTIANAGTDTLGNPCAVVDQKTGHVLLLMTRSPGESTEAQIVAGQSSVSTTVWIIKSRDDGVTWSDPVEISSSTRRDDWRWYGTGPGIGIQLRSGRLLIPCYHTEADSKMYRAHSIYSDDHGETWKLGESAGEHTAECQAAERSDGSIVLNMRGTNKQFFRTVAISRNAGHSWSNIELDKNLPEPACEASLLGLSLMSPMTSPTSRSMWLFCNPPGPTRRNLTLKFSDDEGRSWPRSRVIDAGPAEYSSLTRLPHGTLGVLYELSRSGQPYRPELHFVEVPLN